jgi:ethanolamine utilization protein EutS
MPDIYERLGIDDNGAIGILTLTPYETAMIAADVATKAAKVEIGFLDRFTGSVVISGDVQSVTTALYEVTKTLRDLLGFTVVDVTKT